MTHAQRSCRICQDGNCCYVVVIHLPTYGHLDVILVDVVDKVDMEVMNSMLAQ